MLCSIICYITLYGQWTLYYNESSTQSLSNDTPKGSRAAVIVVRPIGSLVNENKRSTIISIGENYILSRKGESVKTFDKKKWWYFS